MIDYITRAGVLNSILRSDSVDNKLMTKEEHQDVKAIFPMISMDGEGYNDGQSGIGQVAILTSNKLIIIKSLKNRDKAWVEKTNLRNIVSFKKTIKRLVEHGIPIYEVGEVVITVSGRDPIEILRPNERSGVNYQGLEDYEDFVKKLEELID